MKKLLTSSSTLHISIISWLLIAVFSLFETHSLVAQTACQAPPPQSVQITRITPRSMTIVWTPVSVAQTYRIRVQNLATGQFAGTFYVPASTTIPTFTKDNLLPGTPYRFYVSASKCAGSTTNSAYGQAAQKDGNTSIIIGDVIFQCACPIPGGGTGTIRNATVVDTFCLRPGTNDTWHIRGEKSNNSGIFYDFCVYADSINQLHVKEEGTGLTSQTSNNGSRLVVKWQNGALWSNFFWLENPVLDYSGEMCFTITWKIKSRLYSEFCEDSTAAVRPIAPISRTEETEWIPQIVYADDFSITPNPFDEFLVIEGDFSQEKVGKVQLLDIFGRVVAEQMQVTAQRVELSTAGLSSGTYYLSIENGGERKVFPVMK